MSESQKLSTVGDVIAALGGPGGMAKIFGGVPNRFSNYKTRGSFPPSMHMPIYCECVKRGLNIAPELVGMSPDVFALARGDKQQRLPLAAE